MLVLEPWIGLMYANILNLIPVVKMPKIISLNICKNINFDLMFIMFWYISAEKARERFARPAPLPDRQEVQLPVTLTYDVNSLTQLCMNHIAQRLTQHDPRHPLLSLSGISEDVAQKILNYLLKEKLLKPKVLNTFIPW